MEISHVIQSGRYFRRYGAAIILTAAALVLRLAFNPILRSQLPFLTFYPAVIASAWYFGRGPGFASAVLASAAALTVFYPPVELLARDAQFVGVLLFLLFACALVMLVDTANDDAPAVREGSVNVSAHALTLLRRGGDRRIATGDDQWTMPLTIKDRHTL